MADPFPVCYLNGEYLPLAAARVSPLDRAFLFADSVYEVLPAFDGRLFRFGEHFDRLARSLREVRIDAPHSHEQWRRILDELIARNGGGDMYIYAQVTRGMELGRNHTFPATTTPTVFAMASPLPQFTQEQRERGFNAVTVEDFRWGRCDIKSTALLANVLMKQQAADAGANEAIIVRNGEVLEGASTSVLAIIDGVLVTPPDGHSILPGTTREVAIELAQNVLPVARRRLAVSELFAASEIWIAAATRDVLPVCRVDGRPIGAGVPGPWWKRFAQAFLDMRNPVPQ
ncbi:MAG: D-amino acid aminotransferase [Steroidobacteraceae bacterium]